MGTRSSDRPNDHDQTTVKDPLRAALGRFLPRRVRRWAVEVTVRTDKDRYTVGERVEITVEFRNRLPVPVEITTPTSRLWGWSVDGVAEATDELRYTSGTPNALRFVPGERKRFTRHWDGRLKRVRSSTRLNSLPPGEYEIAGYVAVGGDSLRDTTTVTLVWD